MVDDPLAVNEWSNAFGDYGPGQNSAIDSDHWYLGTWTLPVTYCLYMYCIFSGVMFVILFLRGRLDLRLNYHPGTHFFSDYDDDEAVMVESERRISTETVVDFEEEGDGLHPEEEGVEEAEQGADADAEHGGGEVNEPNPLFSANQTSPVPWPPRSTSNVDHSESTGADTPDEGQRSRRFGFFRTASRNGRGGRMSGLDDIYHRLTRAGFI